VPLLEAAFRLYGWQDEDEAAEALATTPEQVRSWRRGTEGMDVADYIALTSVVNVALADAMARVSRATSICRVPPKRSV
jgi:hypothetical protein